MARTWKVRNGRVFFQFRELTLYDLIDCSGLADWNKPRGAVTPIRQQSDTVFGEEKIVDYQRASPDMAAFTFNTRLRDVQNFLISLKCEPNVQVGLGDCGDPGNYYGYINGLCWVRCPPGDLTGEALHVIEGDNVPIGLSNPFNAVYGPYLVDYAVNFLSRRDIAETGGITDIAMFAEECLTNCLFSAGNGQYGYAVAYSQAGSPVDASNVWFTDDYADVWGVVSTNPFAGGEDISAVARVGTVSNHRVVVARGSADAANPAEIAYADVTTIGQTTWVNVDVGAINGQYITALAWPEFQNMFVTTNDGYVYRSQDGGLTWAISDQDTDGNQLNDITFNREGVGWYCGDNDLLVKTLDFGAAWTVVTGPNEGLLNLTTCFVDIERKLEVGDSGGNIYGTVDEGLTWVTTPAQGITATNVVKIRGFETHWKWVIVDIAATAPAEGNSRVLRSTDGGASFRLWDLAQNSTPNWGLDAMYVVDVNRVIVGGRPYTGTAFLTRTETNLDRVI